MTRNERRNMTTAERIAERERKGIPQSTPTGFAIPKPGYQEHLTSVQPGKGSNYDITCTCGWVCHLASLSDEQAAQTALEHVKVRQQPADPFQGL